ncbi:MAG: hypothetical protein A3I01_16875 [Betaproteobacteria bacterium RIFCSPLOWO2_02_FULL_65_24]|nr:MAG: hypothetical protein A3I01_16875 [Betaproteobacteria bacterium RIFCSPLOWO2_02_FULL_65_24]OGA95674.1 MAG: hypothetical protein A3G27_13700 [Betaproteobacteria bacterium RIFCSPLOWO2_12_FULL_66_14]
MNTNDASARHAARMKRVTDAIALRQPDRVPVIYHTQFWHARRAGMNYRQAMYDYGRLMDTCRDVVLELQPDMYASPLRPAFGPTLDAVGYKQLEWPGHGTGDDSMFQYLDREYMKPEEYKEFLFDPTGYFLAKYLPRIGTAFEGLEKLPSIPTLYYGRMFAMLPRFADPDVVRAFGELKKAGEEAARLGACMRSYAEDMDRLGFPESQGVAASAPFDYFGDHFRGSKGILLDMYRRKDELLAALDKAATILTNHTVESGARHPSKLVFIPIHWAMDSFMSLAQFKTFFWPSFRTMLLGLIDAGLVPVAFWESNCSSRLEVIADIPPGKAIYWFESADLVKAKQVLGNVACLRGNVPASMLATGTPEDVDAYCRMLIEKIGRDGGFILDGACGIPDEARPDNVKAMFASVHKYAA